MGGLFNLGNLLGGGGLPSLAADGKNLFKLTREHTEDETESEDPEESFMDMVKEQAQEQAAEQLMKDLGLPS